MARLIKYSGEQCRFLGVSEKKNSLKHLVHQLIHQVNFGKTAKQPSKIRGPKKESTNKEARKQVFSGEGKRYKESRAHALFHTPAVFPSFSPKYFQSDGIFVSQRIGLCFTAISSFFIWNQYLRHYSSFPKENQYFLTLTKFSPS